MHMHGLGSGLQTLLKGSGVQIAVQSSSIGYVMYVCLVGSYACSNQVAFGADMLFV